MKRQPNKSLIGLFLLIGATIFVLIIGQSLWSKYSSSREDRFVMYFEETLQGLSEGASVVFQGVEVGKVTKIKLSADHHKDFLFKVPVYVTLKPLFISGKDIGWGDKLKDNHTLIKKMIKQGLRARLVVQSYLTGQLMIEFAMLPEEAESYKHPESRYLEIPTVLSKAGALEKNLDNLKVQEVLNRFGNTWRTVEKELPVLLPKVTSCVSNMNNFLRKLNSKSEETINNLNKTMQEVSDASKALHNLADYLERHPESLLAGKR